MRVRSKKAEEFAFRHFEVDTCNSGEVAELFHELVDFDDGCHVDNNSRRSSAFSAVSFP